MTRTPPTLYNMPAAETCKTSTRCTLWRLAPPSPSPYLKRKPALSTVNMAHDIAIQQRLSRPKGEDQGGETPTANHRRESHYIVQTKSGDICLQVFRVMNKNVQGLTGKYKLKEKIKLMIPRGIHGYFLQETWLLGTFSERSKDNSFFATSWQRSLIIGVGQAEMLQ